jgi:N-methylhydantoinase A
MYAEFIPLMARQGVDARDFALLAFGGAGPTHAFMLASEVGIDRVLVPPTPGVLCALGCLMADFRSDFIQTPYVRLSEIDSSDLEQRFQAIEDEARAWLGEQQIDQAADVADIRLIRSADMRYRGQSFELTIPAPDEVASEAGQAALHESFHQQYEQIYGHSDRNAEAEIISIRVQIVGQTVKPHTATVAGDGTTPTAPRPLSTRLVRLANPAWEAPVYERAALLPGMRIAGPCIIEQYDSTIFVTPGYNLEIDAQLNVIGIKRDA